MTDSGLPVPKSKKAQATVRSLMDAAVVVFVRDGYIGSRISDISAQADLSNGAFYRYFTDKRHIMMTILTEFLDGSNHFVSVPFEPDDPTRSVRISTERHLRYYQQNSDLQGLLVEGGQVDAEIEKMRIDGYRGWFARIARMMRRAEKLGFLRPGVDPDTAAGLLGGMAEHYAYLVYARKVPMPADPEFVADQIVKVWEGGVFQPSSGEPEGAANGATAATTKRTPRARKASPA